MFQKKEYSQLFWSKFILLLILSLILIFINSHYAYFTKPKSWLSTLTVPLQWLADSPERIKIFVGKNFLSRTDMIKENEQLKASNLLLEYRLQQLSQLSSQNEQLRKLLHASKNLKYTVKVAEVTGISPDPQIKKITVDKGLKDDVFIGQSVLDASGITGQVISTNYFSSQVLLITDSSSKVPVKISRTGYHSVAAGSYINDTLTLLNVPDTIDIKVGDLLVSSGLGGRFPVTYPVAKVSSVDRLPLHGFLNVQATPLAKINNNRLMLLLFSAKHKETLLPSDNQQLKGS